MPLLTPKNSKTVNMPFKSPLRLPSTSVALETPTLERTDAALSAPSKHKPADTPQTLKRAIPVQSTCAEDLCAIQVSIEEDKELDSEIAVLKAKINEFRDHQLVTDEVDVEEELRKWRELLHLYNETRDICLHIFGQLAHIKMTTVKHLFQEFGLELSD